MTKEAEDQIRTVSQTTKTGIDNRKQFIFIYWGGILDLLFDVAMTQFFWVDFWRIRGQPFHHNLRMLSEVECNLFTSMDGRPVPYQNPAPRHMPSPMVECLDYPLTKSKHTRLVQSHLWKRNPRHGGTRHRRGAQPCVPTSGEGKSVPICCGLI